MSERLATIIIVIVSVLVPVLVAVLLKVQPPEFAANLNLTFFPKFHASLNSLTAICLFIGIWFIKNKKIKQHRATMLTAFFLSTVFLISYVTYHSLQEESSVYEGSFRMVYLIILLTHIVLSALIMPLILLTFWKAINNKIEQHRKLAKWTFPLWLYVAISGVSVYVFMAPYY